LPSHKVHRAVCRLLLGSSHPEVDRIMDLPAYILGKKHRLLLHDPFSAFILFGDDPERLGAALLHIFVDMAARDPKVKKLLESLA